MQYIDESLLLKLELSTVRGWMQRPPIDQVYPSSKLLLLFMTLSNCITASKIVVLMPSGTFQATTREIIASSVCCLGNICTYTSYKMVNGFLFSFSFFLQFYVIMYSIFKGSLFLDFHIEIVSWLSFWKRAEPSSVMFPNLIWEFKKCLKVGKIVH